MALRAGALAALVALLVALDPGGWLAAFELGTVDARHRSRFGQVGAPVPIIILDIGEESIARLAPVYGRWPWPRSVHAEVVEYLAQDGASAIGFDLLFAESTDQRGIDARSLDGLAALAAASDLPEVRTELLARLAALRPRDEDERLARAAASAGTVFAAAVFASGELPADGIPEDAQKIASVPLPAPVTAAVQAHALLPYPALREAAASVGHINVLADTDGVHRRHAPLLWWPDRARAVPGLGIAIAAHLRGVPLAELRRDASGLWLGELALPLDAEGQAFIPYRNSPSGIGTGAHGSSPWRHIPYELVLASVDLRAAGQPPPLAAGTFRGQIMLISALAAGIADLRATPLAAATPGTELLAAIIDGLLSGRSLRAPGRFGATLLVLAAGLLAAWATARLRPALALALLLAVSAALGAACWLAFARGWILPLVPPLVALAFVQALGLLLHTRQAERERRWLHEALGHYRAPPVLEELLRAPGKLRLGGERREMSVLFSDIAGFTSLSGRLPPESVGRLLNACLERMLGCVLATQGTLDKFVGDAVMAEWNAPLAQPDHAARACECALDMLAEGDRADAPWRTGEAVIDIRIGINSGEMLVANMGSPQVSDYTVLGNEANTAARLEPLNRAFGTRILVAESTRLAAQQSRPGRYAFRALGAVVLKGRERPLQVHQLAGWCALQDPAAQTVMELHDQGLTHYHARRFDAALGCFEALLRHSPADGPAAHFAARCAQAIATPPPADWAGAWEQAEK